MDQNHEGKRSMRRLRARGWNPTQQTPDRFETYSSKRQPASYMLEDKYIADKARLIQNTINHYERSGLRKQNH